MRSKLFVQDGGAVAVEFAFVMPVMLGLLFCGYETSRMATAFMRLNDSAQMMADLVSRQKSVTAQQIDDFCSGIKIVMRPLQTATYNATVASVTHLSSGVVVDWQDTSCGGGPLIASAATLAAPYIPLVNDSVIVVQGSYRYYPLMNNTVKASILIVKTGFTRSRGGARVSHF